MNYYLNLQKLNGMYGKKYYYNLNYYYKLNTIYVKNY